MLAMASNPEPKSRVARVASAKPQTVRHLNRAAVLDLIRQYQPISRASLARYAGIHRSNISIIVEELQQQGLLSEERSQQTRKGRTPTLISLERGTVRVLAVNLRRTRCTAALVSLSGQTDSTYSFATPATPEAFVAEMASAMQTLVTGVSGGRQSTPTIARMVMSIPGILDNLDKSSSTIWTPGLASYSGVDLISLLEKRLGIPCSIANNAGLGAIAALRAAEKRGEQVRDFVFLVIGDVGVGSGVVLHRSLYSGHDAAYAGEVGHTVIDPRGPVCSCGRRGCWQLYVCDTATWARYNRRLEFTQARFEEFLSEVERGSPKALTALRETAAYLSLGISNIALMLNPQKIMVAGALTRVWPVLQQELKSVFFLPHHHAMIQPVDLPIDTLFLQGAIERGIDLVLSRDGTQTHD